MNAASSSHGVFALLGLIVIAAPFVAPFLKHPKAKFLYAAPLAYLVLTYAKFRWDISQAAGQAQKAGGMFSGLAESAVGSMTDAVSVDFGTYVLVVAALVLAFYAFKARSNA